MTQRRWRDVIGLSIPLTEHLSNICWTTMRMAQQKITIIAIVPWRQCSKWKSISGLPIPNQMQTLIELVELASKKYARLRLLALGTKMECTKWIWAVQLLTRQFVQSNEMIIMQFLFGLSFTQSPFLHSIIIIVGWSSCELCCKFCIEKFSYSTEGVEMLTLCNGTRLENYHYFSASGCCLL